MSSLLQSAPARAAIALALAAVASCVDTDSATSLYLIGPPMVTQVRLNDSTMDAQGVAHTKRVFGFGTHPSAGSADEPAQVVVAATTQSFRIIMSHLLVGNYLENISCTTAVEPNGSHFAFVPIGSTPDDIAKCAVAPDVLVQTCPEGGAHSQCICDIPTGCTEGSAMFKMGQSVGVLDENLDGAADLHQFREGSVGFACGSDFSIKVPIDLDLSYWNPSGDQQVPAVGGLDALGPAVILVPKGPMPANVKCKVVFSDDVVDKSGLNVCIPPGGDDKLGCTEGDTSAWVLQMEPLSISLQNPSNGGELARTDSIVLSASDNIPLSPTSVNNITLSENGTPYTQIVIALDMSGANLTITSTAPGGFDPNATYTLTVPTTVTDTFGEPIVQALTATFTTGA
jgi:hypothetical protein